MMTFYEDYGDGFYYWYSSPRIPPPAAGMHIHPHFETLLILEPCDVRSIVNGNDISIQTGFFAIYSPFCLHQVCYRKKKERARTVVYFGNNTKRDHFASWKKIEPYQSGACTIFKLSEELIEEIRPLHAMMVKKSEFPEQQELLFWLIVNIIIEKVDPADIIISPASTYYINDVLKYIVDHMCEPISIDSLAKEFFISRAKLACHFKEYTGQTIHQLLMYLRISRAAFIIRSGEYVSMQDVANQVGMGNGHNFYPVFKKLRGCTPLQYAKKCEKIRNMHDKNT